MSHTTVVSTEALRAVLTALLGEPYQIRELQVTKDPIELFPNNPINVLINNYYGRGFPNDTQNTNGSTRSPSSATGAAQSSGPVAGDPEIL